jgi:hypothetical protein
MYSNCPEVDGTKDSFNDVPILVMFLELFICLLPQDDYLYLYIIGIILIRAFM